MTQETNLAADLWTLADLLRGNFKQSQYGRVILPFALLRRLECVLEGSKSAVLAEAAKVEKMAIAWAMKSLRVGCCASLRPSWVFSSSF